MNCALFFSDECPKYIIPDKELDCGPNYPIVRSSVYTHQVRCAKHGIIPNEPTLCYICEENFDKNNGLIKRPTYGKKKILLKFHVLLVNFTWYIISQ